MEPVKLITAFHRDAGMASNVVELTLFVSELR